MQRLVRRLLQTLTVLTAIGVIGVGGSLWYLDWRFDQVNRVAGLKTVLVNSNVTDQPVNILVVGSDSRRDIAEAEHEKFGDDQQVKGSRSDTMMIVHADPTSGQLSVLSVPRDLWVTLADVGVQDRINQAFDEDSGGGPARLINTVQRELGIPINHYAEVDFVGFRGVVRAIGGVPVYIPRPARDRISGLNIESAGCTLLDPEMALAYVRSRNYQELVGNRWRTDPTADLGRIKRQQGFIRHTLRRAIDKGARNPITLDKLIGATVQTVSLDDAFSKATVARLARRFRTIDPQMIRTYVLPTTAEIIDKKAVLVLDKGRASDVINRFNGFRPSPPMTPGRVRVRVVAGEGRVDVAALAKRFDTLGFVSVGSDERRSPLLDLGSESEEASNADGADRPGIVTIVRHRPESGDKAQYVEGFLLGGGRLIEDASLTGADVEVIPGLNYKGMRDHNIGFIGPTFTDNDTAGAHDCT